MNNDIFRDRNLGSLFVITPLRAGCLLALTIVLLSIACQTITSPLVTSTPQVNTQEPDDIVTELVPTSTVDPTPTSTIDPIQTPTPTLIHPPSGPVLDRSDLSSVIQWLAYLIMNKESGMVADLVGEHGTDFAPYAVGAFPLGYNNGQEIAGVMERALRDAQPVCLGYETYLGATPDKAHVYFQGINFNWAEQGLDYGSNVASLLFFKLEDGWELTFISPVPDFGLPVEGQLQPCPDIEVTNMPTAETVATTLDFTNVILFQPAGETGQVLEGFCWTRSNILLRPDAWRCQVDNHIYDPCFSASGMEGAVICEANPLSQPNGFRLNLTQPLPYDQPILQGEYAWMLELVDGTTCTFMGGATVAFGDQRVNFGCSDNWVILGQPNPGQIWTVQKVLLSSDWSQIQDSMQVQVKTVWK